MKSYTGLRCRSALLLLAVFFLGLAAGHASATTLTRTSLEKLTAKNEAAVHARITDIHSYWSEGHRFILTDARLEVVRAIKGAFPTRDLVITVLGGTVDDRTTLIIGGPEIVLGSEYVLFLSQMDLPGAPSRLGVPFLAQGVFEIANGPRGRRAVSQAARLPLVPDANGVSSAPGGAEGIPIEELTQTIRRLSGQR